MKVLIDISEDVFIRLFDNGSDASIDDLRQLETTVRKGTQIPEEKSAAAKIFFAINKLGGNNPRKDDEMTTISQAEEVLRSIRPYQYNIPAAKIEKAEKIILDAIKGGAHIANYYGIDCEQCPVESRECANHGCPLVRSVDTIKNGTFVNVTEEELEDIKTDLCDNYCSKRKEWTGDQDDFIEEICVNCPLTRL